MSTLRNSTNVRKSVIPMVWDGFSTAMPHLAQPVLSELFMTPLRKVTRQPRSESLLGHVESRGRSVAVRSVGRGPVVVLVHGWQGHMGQFDEMRARLVEAGYRVVGVDMPAHGESEGRNTNIVEFSDVLLSLGKLLGPIVAVVAHSLGGPALTLALRRGLEVGGALMIAPLISFDFALDEFSRKLQLGKRSRELAARATEKRVGIRRADLDLMRSVRPHERLELIHDRDDPRTRYEDTVRLAQHWNCNLVETQGLGHSRILRDPEVLRRVVRFVDGLPRPDFYRLETHVDVVGEFSI